ncbi:MAG: UDP-glucose/GDP-mannose dehydrogenase family protein [Elusimicrobiota bacterium]|jgi:UDPglucose 6-dehydrogenase|nr:UDP-glucose/GDP-mannose dehydrogenase family protein [Elusimicrobiota bacterium]
MKNVCMVGTGYVGLVSGACFAHLGHNVICVDNNRERIKNLKKGIMPIYEKDLAAIVQNAYKAGRINFTTDLGKAIEKCQIIFITVGTPADKETGEADLSCVFAVAKDIAKNIKNEYKAVVLKSTVPIGTAEAVENIIKTAAAKAKFSVVSNPEFLREGFAVSDFLKPERIVIGASDGKSLKIMRALYKPLTDKGYPLLHTCPATANMIKYASNSFLAMKIMFINELADMCEKAGADVQDVAKGIGLDSRIGHKFLNPGPGFGGSCFPKDTLALDRMAKQYGAPLKLVETTIAENNARRFKMLAKIENAFEGKLRGKKIAVLGVTFKAETDDMRDSPSIGILSQLHLSGVSLVIYDPQGKKHGPQFFPYAKFANSAPRALKGADGALILTEWPEFKKITARDYKKLLKTPLVVDLRNMYSPADMTGVTYHSVGRKPVK